MGILRTNKISGLGTDGTVFQGVTRFDTQGYFVAPSGTTDQRNAGITTTDGTIRFNTDSQKLEFYAQSQWWEMVIDTPNLAVGSNTGAGTRGLFFGGYAPTAPNTTNSINYVNISSTGNAEDFGDLTYAGQDWIGCSSSTRGLMAGSNPTGNTINYVTISSTGNAQSFGSLTQISTNRRGSCSNATRGIWAGGASGPTSSNIIEYVTITSTGNSNDFGDLTVIRWSPGGVASSTRGIFAGSSAPSGTNVIDYITIATLGNATDFGDLTQNGSGDYATASCSNAIRGIITSTSNTQEYITIATLGNAVKFGELTGAVRSAGGACASPTRGVFAGAGGPTNAGNSIEYVTIMTQGNAVDFGDLLYIQTRHGGGFSNAHGGL
jgi:hypothetical protein